MADERLQRRRCEVERWAAASRRAVFAVGPQRRRRSLALLVDELLLEAGLAVAPASSSPGRTGPRAAAPRARLTAVGPSTRLAGDGAQTDTTTAAGSLVFGIFAALAEFERELIRERTWPDAGRRRSTPSRDYSTREKSRARGRLTFEPLAKLLGLAAWRSPQFSW